MRFIILIFTYCCFHFATAQSGTLVLRHGSEILVVPEDQNSPWVLSMEQDVHAFLVFDHALVAAERAAITSRGIALVEPLKVHAWSVVLPNGFDLREVFPIGLVGARIISAVDKVHPSLIEKDGSMTEELVVLPWRNGKLPIADLERYAVGPVLRYGETSGMVITTKNKDILRIAALNEVAWIEALPEPGEPEDIRARSFHRVHGLGPGVPGSPGLTGDGVVVVVNDDGFVGPHIDLHGRTEQGPVSNDLNGDHGDMVAGIVAGAGNKDPRYPGMAPGAFLLIRQYENTLPNTVELHTNDDAMIFSTSYSNGCNAGYTILTQQVDSQIFANPSLLQVFSAGNNGNTDCDYGAGFGWGTITGGHKIGKNVIAVANLTDDDELVQSSSRGPSADGRIKPDISANGNGQISIDPGNLYAPGSGTSAAAPGISGVVALLYEGWRNLNGTDPPSALIKAALLNTADELGNSGPDYLFGWGRVNAQKAWNTLAENRWEAGTVDQGQDNMHTINVPAGVAELRVMVYWSEPEGALQAANALVNDLDITGTDPNGDDHLPWALEIDPVPQLLATPAFKDHDHLNNVEQVHVVQPSPGTWNFTINGFDVPLGPVEYFVVVEYVPEAIALVYPIGGEALAANESHRFRWDAVNITDPVTIGLSLDSGATWTNYPSVPGDQHHMDIGFGDTVITDLMVRVEQNGWTDLSEVLYVMRTPDAPTVVRNCPDSARIQWAPVASATSYILYKLGVLYMDSVDVTSGTTYVYTGLSPIHNDHFAVAAVGPQGIISRRSIATERPQGLVDCQVPFDLALEQIHSPTSTYPHCQPVGPEVIVDVRNVGLATVEGFTVGFRVNADPALMFTVSDTLLPGEMRTITLPPSPITMQIDASNQFEVWAASSQEQFTYNDSASTTVFAQGVAATVPYYEDFEGLFNCTEVSLCDRSCPMGNGLVNELNGVSDDVDWRIDSAGTISSNTGPTVDHTLGDAFGHYAYLEATGACQQQEGHLFTPCIPVPAGQSYELTWWYHMYGVTMGELHVDVLADGIWYPDAIAPILGDQGDQWYQNSLDLATFEGLTVNVRFRGILGSSSQSDMALDDIQLAAIVSVSEEAPLGELTIRPGVVPGTWVVSDPGSRENAADLHVYDAAGRTITTMRTSGNATLLDLRSQAAGCYVLRYGTSTHTSFGRVIHAK